MEESRCDDAREKVEGLPPGREMQRAGAAVTVSGGHLFPHDPIAIGGDNPVQQIEQPPQSRHVIERRELPEDRPGHDGLRNRVHAGEDPPVGRDQMQPLHAHLERQAGESIERVRLLEIDPLNRSSAHPIFQPPRSLRAETALAVIKHDVATRRGRSHDRGHVGDHPGSRPGRKAGGGSGCA